MKKFLTLLLTLITFVGYSQTKIELVIFNAFNDYRIEHNLSPLEFDGKILLAASHHSNYLKDNGYPYNYPFANPHLEKELVYWHDRLAKYGVESMVSGECVGIVIYGIGQTTKDKLDAIISWWDSSPPHKALMLNNRMNKGAISIVEFEDDGVRYMIATLNMIN